MPPAPSPVPVRNLAILGATGSVGRATLDVAARHPQRFRIFALSAKNQREELLALCRQYQPQFAALADADGAAWLRQALRTAGLKTQALADAAALAGHEQTHIVMAAITGAAGLPGCLAAARAGKRLLLANKEALVMGGALFMQTVRAGGASILPVDSEHSAIFQCLQGKEGAAFERLWLTASGGPFLHRDPTSLGAVTPEEAVAHPNWKMGQKISVDSATMMNKALEVIEAHWLFGAAAQQIEIVIHPQSLVHSMVRFSDGCLMAQLGLPDMRAPIACALAWPERIASGAAPPDTKDLQGLQFAPLDTARFPCAALAYSALAVGGAAPVALNAANEEAVTAFLQRRLRFDAIYDVNAEVLAQTQEQSAQSLEQLQDQDAQARRAARAQIAARAMR